MKITNLGLKKPEETDVVNIQDMNDNMDIIEKELQARPEKTGESSGMTVAFTQASKRENIDTGEKASTIMGKIKKWFSDMTVAAFSQVITSNVDLMALTRSGYLVDALAVKNQFTDAKSEALSWDPVFAASNGTLSDGLLVNLTDKNGDANKPRIVRNGATTSIPADCSYGIREVLWSSPNYLICRITGQATDGSSAIWTRYYSNGWEDDWRREITTATIGNQAVNYATSAGNASKVNNHTVNCDVPGDAKFTDTDTWRGIQNNLDSDSTKDSLAAAQGKKLKELIGEKADKDHKHDYFPNSGGTMTGSMAMSNKNGSIYPTYGSGYGEIGNATHWFYAGYFSEVYTSEVHYSSGNLSVCSGATQSRNVENTAWAPMYASAFTQQSSKKYKENIKDITDEVIDQIMKYRVVSYDYINKEDAQGCLGMIAEEIAEINKYPVIYDKDGNPDGLDYSKFVPQLIAFCQKLQEEVNALKR